MMLLVAALAGGVVAWGRECSARVASYDTHCRVSSLARAMTVIDPPSTTEVDGLRAIYFAANGDSWDWSGVPWSVSQPEANPCSEAWQGVTCRTLCDAVGCWFTIVGIVLNEAGLRGYLPKEIDLLSALTFLVISHNSQLTGSIPDSIGNLTELTVLDLSANYITGGVPGSLGKLSKLGDLDLSRNSLSQQLPLEIGELRSLFTLDLSQNNIPGTIPSSIGRLSSLRELKLSQNVINGTIPLEIGALSSLLTLDVSSNEISGPIPLQIGTLTLLTSLTIQINRLRGSLPAEVGRLTALTKLDASSNLLGGQLPSELTECRALQTLALGSNNFTGPIPVDIGALSSLRTLLLYDNHLIGQIPSSVGSLTSLRTLSLSINELGGTIPPEVGLLENLQQIDFAVNLIRGTIPASLGQLTKLTSLRGNSNLLEGAIPPALAGMISLQLLQFDSCFLVGSIPLGLSALPNLQFLDLGGNHLTGAFPDDVGEMVALQFLMLEGNLLDGMVPEGIARLPLETLELDHNLLTGPLPPALASTATLTQLSIGNNRLEGLVPVDLHHMASLHILQLEMNHFWGPMDFFPDASNATLAFVNCSANLLSGSLPRFPPLPALGGLDLSQNALTGSLPHLVNLSSIYLLFLQGNRFEGTVDPLFADAELMMLTTIDVSRNVLTGSLPNALESFRMPQLHSFIAAGNCFEGTIPEAFCQLGSLTLIALDGLSTAELCRRPTWAGLLDSYYLRSNAVWGRIPECFFAMPKLETLHLSGNGLSGTIPAVPILGPGLSDLSLSHNVLTGTIPEIFQGGQRWTNLDLSFNKLRGWLASSEPYRDNAEVTLSVNRLSGRIPNIYFAVPGVSLLRGNMFRCDTIGLNNDVPGGDPYKHQYDCGSNALEVALLVGAGLTVTAGMVVAVLVMKPSVFIRDNSAISVQRWSCFRQWCDWWAAHGSLFVSSSPCGSLDISWMHPVILAESLLQQLRAFSAIIALVLVVGAMPAFVGLSYLYGMYQDQYAWVASAAFLSGWPAAVGMTMIFVLVLVVVAALGRRAAQMQSLTATSHPSTATLPGAARRGLYCTVAVVNVAVVWAVNGAFVMVYVQLDHSSAIAVAILLSLFKIAWGVCLREAIISFLQPPPRPGRRSLAMNNVLFFSCLMLFNTILAPCLATLVANSSCFFYAIIAPPAVSADYTHTQCAEFLGGTCVYFNAAIAHLSYEPPFSYSYQCSSALLVDYAYVFVYKYAILGLLYPVMVLVAHCQRDRTAAEEKPALLQRLLMVALPPLCRAGSLVDAVDSPEEVGADFLPAVMADWLRLNERSILDNSVFSSGDYAVRVTMMLSALLTFGVVLPPLGLLICLSVLSTTAVTQIGIAKFVSECSSKTSSIGVQCFDEVVNQCAHLRQALSFALPPLSVVLLIFYSSFVIDAAGDQCGAIKGFLITLPMVLFTAFIVLWLWMGVGSPDSSTKCSFCANGRAAVSRIVAILSQEASGGESNASETFDELLLSEPLHRRTSELLTDGG